MRIEDDTVEQDTAPDRIPENCVAIVGMAVRAPKAPDLESFWEMCVRGEDGTTTWSRSATEPTRVPTAGLLSDVDLFDAASFGLSPAEAEVLDPQHRVFLELCWDALDGSGVVPTSDLPTGVYASAAPSSYLVPQGSSEAAKYQVLTGNAPDFLATRVSYLLNLEGEAVNVQTGCSSSLVAVHLAVESLLSGNIDVALAGGVTVNLGLADGYVFEEGMITSPDGVCRPFDAESDGAVPGNGAGVVVLQRLEDAIEQGRVVHAVIRSTAVNNDGSEKTSFLAPNRRGQTDVLLSAISRARIPVESVGYLETHGTGTRLGDAIELAAAQDAFTALSGAAGFCAVGSLKANFGHLDRAAGVVGLIKAALCVERGVRPPLRNLRSPLPDFVGGAVPFTFPTGAELWDADVRRAGVSSFGVGGTNAHVIVEQPQTAQRAGSAPVEGPQAIPLSAPHQAALTAVEETLRERLDRDGADLDLLHTLAAGRRRHRRRSVLLRTGGAGTTRVTALEGTRSPGECAGAVALVLAPAQAAPAGDFGPLLSRYPVARERWEMVTARADAAADRVCQGLGTDRDERAAAVLRIAQHLAVVELLTSFGVEIGSFHGRDDDPLLGLLQGDSDLERCLQELPYAPAPDAEEPTATVDGPCIDLAEIMSHPDGCVAGLFAQLSALWVAGQEVDWDAVNLSGQGSIAELPGYPFQRQSHWAHAPGAEPGATGRYGRCVLEEPVWVPDAVRPGTPRVPAQVRVVGEGRVADALRERLARMGEDTRASSGSAVVVVLEGRDGEPAGTPSDFDLRRWLRETVLGPAGALAENTTDLVLVSRGGFAVLPGELPDLRQSGLLGVRACAPHEVVGLRASVLDLEPCEPGGAALDVDAELDQILWQFVDGSEDRALRGGSGYRRVHRPVDGLHPSLLRWGGTYLVLGGTGNLGMHLAETICEQTRARVVLAGRSAAGPRSAEIQAAERRIRASGSRIEWATVDCTDAEDLRRLLAEVAGESGRVDGVFHLAGDTDRDAFSELTETTEQLAFDTVRAKVDGARFLAAELENVEHDFVALYSSLSTVIGARTFGPYVSANAFLDALARVQTARTGRPWISIQWDGWSHDGRSSERGLSREEGALLLRAALCTRSAVVAPATEPIAARLRTISRDLRAVAGIMTADSAPALGTDALEAALAAIRAVTGHSEVPADETFVALGVDSLQMMRFAARVRPLLRPDATLARLVACRTPRQASELLIGGTEAAAEQHAATVAVHRDLLSTMQERLYYENQLGGDSDSYNVPFGWTVNQEVSEPELLAAVRAVLAEHTSLRSVFATDRTGIPRRTVIDASAVPVDVVGGLPDGEHPERLLEEFVSRPFDLAANSARVLLRQSSGRWQVIFVCHHIAVDGWSTDLIGGSLVAHLAGGESARPAGDYADFVAWEQAFRAGPEHARQLDFWRRTLDGAAPTVPPRDRDADGGDSVGTLSRSIGARTVIDLQEMVAIEGTTLFAAALAAFAGSLARWCRTDEVLIATNISKRPLPSHENIVGLLVDPVLLRLRQRRPDHGPTLGASLADTRRQLLEAMGNSDIPFLDVLPLLRRESRARSGAFGVIATMFDSEAADSRVEALEIPLPGTAKFPLAVEFRSKAGVLRIRALYDRSLYREATIGTLLDDMVRYLEALAVQGPCGALPVTEARPPSPLRERLAARLTSAAAAGPSGEVLA
ncbi:SDR family NAD(P)-dependent oxidoreductase [Streptomyces sp. MUM 2J]|uniref:SDR family NAD(P)-dependent oxidoreductase n=1 Tax=Streptomyces sp. MUM 2J TaxID=2791987 RepID=UPI001F042D8F|nr:SDR family NAD(P)-dependent oxidoreductase [Streptomyces sp. MUM 2J]